MKKEMSLKEGLQKIWDDARRLRKINKELKEDLQDLDGFNHIPEMTEEDVNRLAHFHGVQAAHNSGFSEEDLGFHNAYSEAKNSYLKGKK